MKSLFLIPVLAVFLVGCIKEPVGVHLVGAAPTTPPDPARVASCKSTRTWHTIWVLSGSIFGGAAGAGGGAAAGFDNTNVKTGIAIGVAASGLLAAISTAAAGIEADQYSTDNCQQILQQDANVSATP